MGTNLGYGRTTGSSKVQQMEDALGVIRNKESMLAGSSNKKNVASSLNNNGLKGNYHHLEVDEKWGSLSKKEK